MGSLHNALDSGWNSIGDLHFYLNLHGAGPEEYEFYSGYKGSKMIQWKDWMKYVWFGEQTPCPETAKAALEQAVKDQEKGLSNISPANNIGYSPYEIISMNSKLSKFKALVDYVGYPKINEGNITLLAPVDDMFDDVIGLYHPMAMSELMQATKVPQDQSLWWHGTERPAWQSLLQIVRYHILPYELKEWQLTDRKLRLRTDLDLQWIDSDWTNGKTLLMNPISTRVSPSFQGEWTNPTGNPMPPLPDVWYPKKAWEVQVLDIIKCANNSYVYVISRPLVYQSVL